nr:YfjI family protein [uncultured Pseudodesulfovibrio sp.]
MQTLPQISNCLNEGALRDLVFHTSNSVQVPPDMVLMNCLGGFGAAVNGKLIVTGPSGHEEPCNLYMMPIGKSGERKSAIVKIAKKPHEIWQSRRNEGLDNQRRDAKRKRRYYQSKISRLNREACNCEEQDAFSILAEIEELEARMPELPSLEECFFDDATIPALKRVLANQKGLLSHMEAEPKIAKILQDKDSTGLGLLCNAYDSEEMIVDRVKEGRMVISRPAINMCSSFQPAPAIELLRKSHFMTSGLAGRFIYVQLAPMAGWRSTYTPRIPQECLNWYDGKVEALLNIELKTNQLGIPGPYRLSLDDEATRLYQAFRNWAEPALQPAGPLAFSKSWGSKLPGKVLRLSALLHCINNEDPMNSQIDGDSMRQAIDMGNCFIHHAQSLYHHAQFCEHIDVAKEVVHWASSHGVNRFTAAEARKAIAATPKKVKMGIEYLLNEGCIYEDLIGFANNQASKGQGRNKEPHYVIASHLLNLALGGALQ